MTQSLTPDLDDTPCSVAACFYVADGIGTLSLRIKPPTHLPTVTDDLVLEIPLCGEHQHLLRTGVTRFELDTGT